MMEKMKRILIIGLINLRWAYFHVSPRYIKFYMGGGSDEAHFQHIKTGAIHSNLVFADITGD